MAVSPHRVNHPVHNRGTAEHIHDHKRRLDHQQSSGNVIGAGSIGGSGDGGQIAPASIDGTDIAPSSITTGNIQANAITTNLIAAGAITTGTISAGAITATTIAAGAISSYIFAGNTITLAASGVQSSKVLLDQSGIRVYDASGNLETTLSAVDGSLTVYKGTITGATIQTTLNSSSKVIMDSAGLRAYNSLANQTFNLDTSGNLAVYGGSITGSTIQTSSSTGARVVLDSMGLRAYDATNKMQVDIDAASGLITATGVISALPGSIVPWQSTGFVIGGGNLLTNSSAEDPTSYNQTLYCTTSGLATSGSFTLKFGSNTPTAQIAWNARSADVQAALNAPGVLPAGVSALCINGPLPSSPITISISGYSTVTPSVITIPTQSVVGGTMVVGAMPTWWSSIGYTALDYIQFPQAYHGGNVFRLTNLSTGFYQYMRQTVGPYAWTPGVTEYTLSAYFRAPIAQRTPAFYIDWNDANGNLIYQTNVTATFSTLSDQWQRLLTTQTVPLSATRQQIVVFGNPTSGAFKLAYNGQTTSILNYNATAAQVQAALQALSNVGAGGISNVTGSAVNAPNGVTVSFVAPPAATPVTMTTTVTTAFSGGSSPGVNIANMAAVSAVLYCTIKGASVGEIFYVDAIQFEVGDAPTAYAPRPDEILADTIQANMINVAQLSAISANLGSIVSGTITGATIQTATSGARVTLDQFGLKAYDLSGANTVSISSLDGSLNATKGTLTGSVVQTATTNPRVAFDNTGFYVTDQYGNKTVNISSWQGLILNGDSTLGEQTNISWVDLSGNQLGYIYIAGGTRAITGQLITNGPWGGGTAGIEWNVNSTVPQSTYTKAYAGNNVVNIIDGNGASSFIIPTQYGMRCLVGSASASYNLLSGGYQYTGNITFNNGATLGSSYVVLGYCAGGPVMWAVSAATSSYLQFQFYNGTSFTQSGNFYFMVLTY